MEISELMDIYRRCDDDADEFANAVDEDDFVRLAMAVYRTGKMNEGKDVSEEKLETMESLLRNEYRIVTNLGEWQWV